MDSHLEAASLLQLAVTLYLYVSVMRLMVSTAKGFMYSRDYYLFSHCLDTAGTFVVQCYWYSKYFVL